MSALIRLDKIIADAVGKDSQSITMTVFCTEELPLGGNATESIENTLETLKPRKMASKSGSVAKRSAERMRASLLLALSQILQFCLECFLKDCAMENILVKSELSFTGDEVENRKQLTIQEGITH